MCKNRYIFLFICFFVQLSCGHENKSIDHGNDGKNIEVPIEKLKIGRDLHLKFEKYTMEQGLINNTIFDIDEDTEGNIWLSTESGISIFNGIDFKPLPEREHPPYDVGAVQVLELDKNGDAWFFEQGQGLIHFDVSLQNYTIYKDSVIGIGFSILPNKMYINDNAIYFTTPFGKFDRIKHIFEVIDKNANISCRHPYKDIIYTIKIGNQIIPTDKKHFFLTSYDISNHGAKIKEIKVINTLNNVKDSYNDVTVDTNGVFYLGSQESSFCIYNSNTGELDEIYPDPAKDRRFYIGGSIRNLHYDVMEQCVWMTGYCHLLRYDCKSKLNEMYSFIRYIPDSRDLNTISEQYCSKVLRDSKGNLFVGTHNSGLNINNYEHRKFKTYQNLYGDTTTIPQNEVTACAFDTNGRLCIGTKKKGIALLKDSEIGHFNIYLQDKVYGQERGNLNSISGITFHPKSQKFYISAWGNYIFEFDSENQEYKTIFARNMSFEDMKKIKSEFFIIMSKLGFDDNIYFGDWDGWLDIYNPNEQSFLTTGYKDTICPNIPKNTLTRAIYISSDSFLYMSYDAPANLQRIKLNEDVFKGCIFSNKHILGTSVPLEKMQISRTKESEGIHGQITIITEENKDIFWIGTTSGLYRYDINGKRTAKYGKEQGFKSDYIHSMEWHGKHLWIGTHNGLYCFDTETKRILSSWYKQNGLPDNHFNLNASAKFNDSIYAFGTNNGVVVFEPKKLINTTQNIELKGLFINGAVAAIKNSFGPNEKNLTFQFGTDDVANTSKMKYQYKLSGIDLEWQTTDIKPVANYTNLHSGSYQFMYKKLSQDIDDKPMVFAFTIRNPWYKTWWFISLVGIGMVGFLYLLNKRRQKIEADKEIERSKMIKYLQIQTLQSQINPHFIFNVLGTMQNQILNKDPEQANKHLINLSKLIRRFLDSSVSSNVGSGTGLTTSEITLEEELELLHMYIQFEQLQREGKFDYEIIISDDISIENEYLPPLIVQPYVENAIKHGLLYKETKGKLIVSFSKKGEQLICKVIDDGVGRDAAQQYQKESKKIYVSRGKKLVEDRVKILNEVGYEIILETSNNELGGTTVTISIQ